MSAHLVVNKDGWQVLVRVVWNAAGGHALQKLDGGKLFEGGRRGSGVESS